MGPTLLELAQEGIMGDSAKSLAEVKDNIQCSPLTYPVSDPTIEGYQSG